MSAYTRRRQDMTQKSKLGDAPGIPALESAMPTLILPYVHLLDAEIRLGQDAQLGAHPLLIA